jgi:tetratricopeptide (TPR) repeat protein
VAGVSGLTAARRATVQVCDRTGAHRGQGLLLNLPSGSVVLTCHHVIEPLEPTDLYVRIPNERGQLGEPIHATVDAEHSRPESDAVVLAVDLDRHSIPHVNPLLHALDPDRYDGVLKVKGLSRLQPDSFLADLGLSTSLNLPAEGRSTTSRERYVIPVAYQLANSTDSRQGISGSVALCEDGVLGLVHFARPESADVAREAYLVPLTVWGEAWPAIGELIEPLIDRQIRAAAKIKRARDLQIGFGERSSVADVDIVIAKYQPDLYLEREEERLARAALQQSGAVVIVGKPLSGKTRLATELIRSGPDALVVIPRANEPPAALEALAVSGPEVVLFIDDLHQPARQTMQPLSWRERLVAATGDECRIICTSRDGDDWEAVQRNHGQLLDLFGSGCCVFLSAGPGTGNDLDEEQGWTLAEQLDLDKREFSRRFDGTPGSLVLDLDEMRRRYERLSNESSRGVAMSRLLDSAKILSEATLPVFPEALLRLAAEQIRGDGSLSAETWEALERQTAGAGFGRFDGAREFQTYRPYLERCVAYKPSADDIKRLGPILEEFDDGAAMAMYTWGALIHGPHAEKLLRERIKEGDVDAYVKLGIHLADVKGREAEAEEAYRDGIKAGASDARNPLAQLIAKQPGREKEAEQTFRDAIAAGEDLGHYGLGCLLARQPSREAEAEQELRAAVAVTKAAGIGRYELAHLLLRQPGRERDAEEVLLAALKAVEAGGGYLAPRMGSAYMDLGTLLAQQAGRQGEAEVAFKRAIELGEETAYLKLAVLLHFQGIRQDEAELAARAAIESGQEVAYHILGLILERQPGREDEAEQAYRQGIAAGVDGIEYNLGTFLARQRGREKEAVELLRKALEGGHGEAALDLADLLAEQPGREDEAEEAFRAAVAAGQEPGASRGLGRLLAGQGRVAEAEQAIRRAIDVGSSKAVLDLGFLLWNQPGREKEAEEAFRAAVEERFVPAFYGLGILLWDDPSRQDEARKLLTTAANAGFEPAAEALQQLSS